MAIGGFIMKKLKGLCYQYRHGIPLMIYGIIYLVWFTYLEKTVTRNFSIIHMDIDDSIPFNEVFIIPYLLWFLYVAAVVVFLFFKNKEDYYRNCIYLFTGMTIFLLISTLWPNGHYLRPFIMPRDNIFTDMVSALYRTDTPTNLWPSIHVYNSIAAHLAVMHSKELADKKGIRIASLVLCISIVLSTMFLKQHSVFDVITAFIMAAAMYVIVYRLDILTFKEQARTKQRSRPQIG